MRARKDASHDVVRESASDSRTGWATSLADLAARSTVLLAVAGLLAVMLRRQPATLRHRVWTLALAGVVCLPAVGVLMPGLPLTLQWPGALGVSRLATTSDVAGRCATSARG